MFDLSNAQVAKILQAKVVIVSQGGIGKPIDEVSQQLGISPDQIYQTKARMKVLLQDLLARLEDEYG